MDVQEFRRTVNSKSKQEMRRVIRDYRDRISPEEVERASTRVHKKLFSLDEFMNSECVMFYMSFRNELDTYTMIERSMQIGKTIVLPRITVENSDLDAYIIANMEEDTAPGILGIMEPRLDARRCEYLGMIDLCIVPGIAFDKRGHRIGWGKGFYDKFLPRLDAHAKKIGIGYDFQLVERIETHDGDISLDAIVTETEVLRFTEGSGTPD